MEDDAANGHRRGKENREKGERMRGAAEDANKRSSASNFFATSLAVFSPLLAE